MTKCHGSGTTCNTSVTTESMCNRSVKWFRGCSKVYRGPSGGRAHRAGPRTMGGLGQPAHRNETAVGLGGGPRPKNSAAVRPADSAGRTAGRRSGRPKSAGRDRRGGFWPKIWPTPPGGGSAGRPAGRTAGLVGTGGSAGRPAEIGRPNRRAEVRPAESAGRTAGSFRYPPNPMCPLKKQSPPLRPFK